VTLVSNPSYYKTDPFPKGILHSFDKGQDAQFLNFTYFGKELYMFPTDLLSVIKSLNTVFTAIGICHISYVDCLLPRSLADSQHN